VIRPAPHLASPAPGVWRGPAHLLLRRAVRHAAVLTSGLALVLGATSGAALQGPEHRLVADTVTEVPVRVATYNIHNDLGYSAARSAVRRLVPKADVIGLQEFYSPLRVPILAELATDGWQFWKPALIGADPVLYDADVFSFLSGQAVEMTPGLTVENPKSFYRTMYARPTYATVVRLVHKPTGQRVTVVNAHLIARATKDGRPFRKVPRRVYAFKQGMAAVASAVARERQSATVFAVGDWNVHYNFDARERVGAFPFRQFKRQGMQSVWKSKRPLKPTINDKGVIDGVWAATRPDSAKVLGRFPESDHRPVLSVYRLRVVEPVREECPLDLLC
jgi:endonuclease/exonuclease/phosphatase family metal-dependent hydrolase